VRNLTWLVACVAFIDTVFFTALVPLLPHLAQGLSLSKGAAGFLTAAYAIGSMAGTLLAAAVATRGPVKPAVVAGLGLMAACTVAFGFAGSVVELDVARLGQGIGDGVAWTGAIAWLVATAPPAGRGRAIGTASGASAAGALAGPLLGGVAAVGSVGPVFTAVGLVAVGLLCWTLLTPGPREEAAHAPRGHLRGIVGWRMGAALWLGALGGVLTAVLAVLAPLALARQGIGVTVIAAVFFASALIRAVGSPLLGRWVDHRGHRTPLQAGLVAAVGVSLLLAWAVGPWPSAVLVLLAGVAYSAFWVPAMSMVSVASGPSTRAVWLGFGLWNLAWGVGWTVGSAGGGALAAAAGDAPPYLLLAGLSLVTVLAVRRYRPRPTVAADVRSVPGSAA